MHTAWILHTLFFEKKTTYMNRYPPSLMFCSVISFCWSWLCLCLFLLYLAADQLNVLIWGYKYYFTVLTNLICQGTLVYFQRVECWWSGLNSGNDKCEFVHSQFLTAVIALLWVRLLHLQGPCIWRATSPPHRVYLLMSKLPPSHHVYLLNGGGKCK